MFPSLKTCSVMIVLICQHVLNADPIPDYDDEPKVNLEKILQSFSTNSDMPKLVSPRGALQSFEIFNRVPNKVDDFPGSNAIEFPMPLEIPQINFDALNKLNSQEFYTISPVEYPEIPPEIPQIDFDTLNKLNSQKFYTFSPVEYPKIPQIDFDSLNKLNSVKFYTLSPVEHPKLYNRVNLFLYAIVGRLAFLLIIVIIVICCVAFKDKCGKSNKNNQSRPATNEDRNALILV